MKQVAVIILNWNGIELLKRFLPLVAAHTISEDADLIVADNGSTDGSIEWVKQNFTDVLTLDLEQNHGFAKGYNIAIGRVADRYRYALLLNSDVETTEGYLQPLLAYISTHPDVAALQPKILSWADKSKFEYAGAAGGYIDRNGFPYCRGRLLDSIESDEGQYDGEPVDVAWASGAALLTRIDRYQELGGLDEKFFAHMEEIDLCLRMRAAGYRVMALTGSKVYHVGGASLPAGNPKKVYLNFRNNLLLLYKNLPRKDSRPLLFRRRLVYDTTAFLSMVAKGDFKSAGAVLRAHRDFRKMKRLYTHFPSTNIMKSLPGASRNIIFDHYIKRKNK